MDYPGKIAAVVFAPGCNLGCYYCHNRVLLSAEGTRSLIPVGEVLAFLEERKGFLDAVVISGGEPTLQDGLEGFASAVKKMGYLVKLDTNGTNPRVLEELMGKGLLDYVAMDIKAPFSKYEEICGTGAYLEEIQKSIALLLETDKGDYEFRTTMVPDLDEDDVESIAAEIAGAKLYVLQQYRPPDTPGGKRTPGAWPRPHSAEYIRRAAGKAARLVKKCITRGI
ncbi:MAG: anaerobic ribonucleoside-triphosphate reductase activating protein [Peptococcaceae bacterium]|nr:anaerobic ribonucleoside-triphosphate reductase activating protein [Peptococcaceae bacterium]MDH7524863.1 anaerobic ribonucleoside-triphosphate reductase activating protein [Peptococcaceae bacterium]